MSALRTLALVGLLTVGLAGAQDQGPKALPASAPGPKPLPAADRDAGQASLVKAYQKEFAFLANEERSLSERLGELDREREQRLTSEDAALEALEAELRAAQGEVEGLQGELEQLDEQLLALEEGGDSVDALVSQIEATRSRYERPPLAQATDPTDVEGRTRVVRESLDDVGSLLRELSSVRRSKGTFFLPDGRSTEAELLHVGAIATLGVSPDAAGVLAPAGDGGLMLWPVETTERAREALAGPLPEVLPLYLYENTDKLAEVPQEKTLAELVEKAGIVGYVIVGLGALAALLILLRFLLLAFASGSPDRVLEQLEEFDLDGAQLVLRRQRSCASRVLAAMLPHLEASADELESAASGAILRQTLRIERFDTAILVSAAVAPLLGLLGTVTGMISTFDVITVFGTGDPKLLSGGISEALITTQLGLSVAIPALLGGNLLSGWAERIRSGMERAALQAALVAAQLRPEPSQHRPISGVEELDRMGISSDEDAISDHAILVVGEDSASEIDAIEGVQRVGANPGKHVSAHLPAKGPVAATTEATASAVGPLAPAPEEQVQP